MKIALLAFVIAFLTMIPDLGHAQGCSLPPIEINEKMTSFVQATHKRNESFPNKLGHTRASFDSPDFSNFTTDLEYEGFLRPLQDRLFSVLPIPIVSANLKRKEHVLYVCAHIANDPSQQRIVIYFLQGGGLEPGSFGFLGTGTPELKIKPMKLSVTPLDALSDGLDSAVKDIPLINILIGLPTGVVRTLREGIGGAIAAVGAGVERLIITNQSVILENGIDMKDASKARLRQEIKFEDLPKLTQ